MRSFNDSISVDCVVFGFSGDELKLLLVKKLNVNPQMSETEMKLPGSLIYNDEDLTSSAYRVLENMTGISNLYLKQLKVFSQPDRITGSDLEWLNRRYSVGSDRVVTVAYYALIKLDDRIMRFTHRKGVEWQSVASVKHLALDHKDIVVVALDALAREFMLSPIAFELLPRKFTIRQLQTLYEVVLGIEIDNRNFRKKISTLGYLTKTDDKEVGVAHKPAFYYTFNKAKYEKEQRGVNSISRLYF